MLARVFQHELDHLDGVLMFDRMTPDQRKQAMADGGSCRSPSAEVKKRRIRLRVTR